MEALSFLTMPHSSNVAKLVRTLRRSVANTPQNARELCADVLHCRRGRLYWGHYCNAFRKDFSSLWSFQTHLFEICFQLAAGVSIDVLPARSTWPGGPYKEQKPTRIHQGQTLSPPKKETPLFEDYFIFLCRFPSSFAKDF